MRYLAEGAEAWVGAQLSREPWRPALLEIYESIGGLREHDDREQFLAGVDLVLAGIATVR